MERIIKIYSNEGDLVFDPFGGAGTTAIAAKLLSRKYVITELDKHYVEISKNNLDKVELNELGNYVYSRDTISNIKAKGIPKKVVEDTYLSLCEEKGKPFSLIELENDYPEVYNLILKYTGDKKKLISIAKRKLEANNQLNLTE
jgi:adenine specific DNA methylase Mod